MFYKVAIVAMLIVIVIFHELGHILAAVLQGKKVNGVYFGIPIKEVINGKEYTSLLYKFNYKEVEYGFSWLIFGGAVDFDGLETATYREKIIFFLAGPFMNFLMGFIPMLYFLGIQKALWLMAVILGSVFTAIGMLFGGTIPLSELTGPVGAIVILSDLSLQYGFLFVWVLLNISLLAFNLLPIPALDGGHVFVETMVKLAGPKSVKIAKFINKLSFYLLVIIIIISMTKDLW